MRGMWVPIAGIFWVKYNRNIQIIKATQPLRINFSPAFGGSQKVDKIRIRIAEKKFDDV